MSLTRAVVVNAAGSWTSAEWQGVASLIMRARSAEAPASERVLIVINIANAANSIGAALGQASTASPDEQPSIKSSCFGHLSTVAASGVCRLQHASDML